MQQTEQIAPQPVVTLNLNQHPDRDMRLRRQWVCWRYEWIDNKWRKPPFHPGTGRKIDPTQRQQFGTYKESARAYLAGGYSGIGYVFYPEEHYVRLDFDNCRNPESGEVDQWVKEVLSYLKIYAEISPSGDGLHAIARGKLHGRDRRVSGLGEYHKGTLEMYASTQNYFTWTNERYGEGTITEASEECNGLYDCVFWQQIYDAAVREHLGGVAPAPLSITVQTEPLTAGQQKADNWLLNKARQARNGAAFSRLYDQLPGAGSQHEDDFRLCLMLLYWTQDRAGVPDLSWADRLYRQSARFTAGRWEKWDRKLGRYTYGQVTLQKAYLQRHIQFGPGRSAAVVVAAHQKRLAAENLDNQD